MAVHSRYPSAFDEENACEFEETRKGEKKIHTDAIDRNLDPRAQNLVPAVYAPDQPPAALEAARAAERVREGGRGREVLLERLALGRGRRLREEVDDLGDLGFWMVLVSKRRFRVADFTGDCFKKGEGKGRWSTWVFHGCRRMGDGLCRQRERRWEEEGKCCAEEMLDGSRLELASRGDLIEALVSQP